MQTKDLVGTRYRLDQRIASGGMGDVWAARDELLGRQIALKLLHPHLAAEQGFLQRFRAEAQAAARLSHPGIVAVYDYGEEPGTAYLAMELVDGDPLSAVIRQRGRLSAEEALHVVSQTAEALAAAHAEGLVHRDVKPANILLCPDGRVKVTDFGIVRAMDTPTVTKDGTVFGTVAYMSPEQVRGERVTAASDLYSLGVVAYECLSGSRPYHGGESIAVALAHLHDPVPPLPADVPAGVRRLVLGMLEKRPRARPASAGAVAEAARRLAGAGEAPWARGGVRAASPQGGVDGSQAAEQTAPGEFGLPTQPFARDAGSGHTTRAVTLPGLAEPQTKAMAPPPRPTVLRPGTAERRWARLATVCAGALLLALLLAATFSGGGGGGVRARPEVTVPRLQGVALGDAEHQLEALGLHPVLGTGDPSPSAIVVGEQPSAGTRVPRGSKVRLVVRASTVRQTTTDTTSSASATTRSAPPGATTPGPTPPPKGPPGGDGPPGHSGGPPGRGHGH
ncbi:MAG: protein kinase [Actinomycetota bacterium]|nr:protein kinase [Actinomycetota bacterium]